MPSLGPDCAVLTSIGTVYLYRLTYADMRAYSDLPGTRLSADNFRTLLSKVGSTSISDKGIPDAGPLGNEQIESLRDEEIERLAEAYLESTNLRWYQQEGASASPAVVRGAGEPATKFLDRLVNWHVASRGGNPPGLSDTLPPVALPSKKAPAPESGPRARREAWIGLALLLLVAALATGALVQDYFAVNALRRQHDALAAQVRETNGLLGAHVARMSEDNAQLRRRIESLEAALHAQVQAQAAAKLRETKPKAVIPKSATPKARQGSTRGRSASRLQR